MLEKGINCPKLASELGINRTTLTRYLSCKTTPSLSTAIILADYFNCTLDYLLGFEKESYYNEFKSCPPFTQQFAFLIEKYGKTKTELHDNGEITESLIYDWQRGTYAPTIYNVIKLAKFFGCSIDYVIGRGN
ncbi:MAG: helix-turn-helix domain-containing protein, partial [Clostridia bacterium]|nr:helix-turn-helix domain-containing protein [Clostridia bacterium]